MTTRNYLIRVLTALGQMTHHRDVSGAMVMDTEVRSGLIRDGWALWLAENREAFNGADPDTIAAALGPRGEED